MSFPLRVSSTTLQDWLLLSCSQYEPSLARSVVIHQLHPSIRSCLRNILSGLEMQLERSYSPGKYFSPDKLYSNTKLNSSYFLTDPYKGMVLVLSSKILGKSAFSAPQAEMAGASGGYKGGYWGYFPPPRILGVNTPPLESWG